MESGPDLNAVYQAIYALYRGTDTSNKEKASVWLGEFQNSIFAWQISDKLLREKRDVESSYFAAQTMRSKIHYSFHELPENSYESLKDSLLQHLRQCDESMSRAIVTQLVLALADLYLQVPSWTVPVRDLVNQFNTSSYHIYILLEILTMLAEEANSRRLRIGANRRKQLRDDFLSQADIVLQFLSHCIEKFHENVTLVSHIFKCLGAWLSLSSVPTNFLASSVLMERLFQILANLDCDKHLHDSATDCVVQALYLIENPRDHPELATTLFVKIHELQATYQLTVAHDDEDKLQNFCRIFTEMAESLLPFIVENSATPLGSLRTLDLLLDCVGHYDYSMAEITFNVWYRLSELIYRKDSLQTNQTFIPYIQRLLQALYRHCRFDADFIGIPTENDDLCEFRRKVSEVIKDVIFIIGSSSLFKEMYSVLQNKNPPPSWEEAEASLFVMSVVAKNVMPDDEEMINDLLDSLSTLPDDSHIAILYTSINLIGQLADWFSYSATALEKTVHFLVKCLKNSRLAIIAAYSLETVCMSSTRDSMTNYAADFIHFCLHLDVYPALPNDAVLALLRSTSSLIIGASGEIMAEKLKELCFKQSSPLLQILNDVGAANISVDKENKHIKDPVIWLSRLSAIFRNLGQNNGSNGKPPICSSIVMELLPVIIKTCEKYESNVRVVEHCCKTLRFMIRCMGIRILPLLSSIVEKMYAIYERHPHSCFLYLGSVMVDEYGKIEDFVPGLTEMLKAFVGAAFKFLEQPSAMQRCPDTVDDLFRFCLRFVQKAPAAFFTCEIFQPLFQCALAAVSVDHRDASQSVHKFLTESIEFAQNCKQNNLATNFAQNSVQVILDNGELLVNNLLYASIYCLSAPVIRGVADVLLSLSKFDLSTFNSWLSKGLKNLPQKGTLTASAAQINEFHQTLIQSNDTKIIHDALRDFTRLYR